jgi:hypothetical protein
MQAEAGGGKPADGLRTQRFVNLYTLLGDFEVRNLRQSLILVDG